MQQRKLSPIQLSHLKRQVSKEEMILKVASDFFHTYDEFREELAELYENISKLRGPAGKAFLYGDFTPAQLRLLKGRPGKDAEDIDYEKITLMLLGKIRIPQDGKPPIKGKDYFTSKEIEEVAKEAARIVVKNPSVPSKGVIENICTLIEARVSKKQWRIEDIIGLEERLKDILRRAGEKGYMHGGGDTVSAGTNITITRNLNGDKIINSTGGGLTKIVISGTINDTNTVFTAPTAPTYLVINGVWYESTGGAITWTGTTSLTLSTPIGTGSVIWGF